MAKKRKHFTPTQKVQIIKKHLVVRIPLSDLCDEYNEKRGHPLKDKSTKKTPLP